jgi:hypothetical protein
MMANNDFKVGDRVRVYETCPYVGIVEKTGNDTAAFNGCILVRGIGNQFGWHHEKKCRRLKPKKRRIIWIKESDIPAPLRSDHAVISSAELVGDKYIQFVEAKK